MSDIAVCTIVSRNYLSHARVFFDSLRRYHDGIAMHLLLVDRVDGYFNPEEEIFTLTEIESLPVDDLYSFCFKYNVTELNTAVKPFFLDYLFNTYGYEKVVYFDPDILVMDSLDKIFRVLDEHPVVLTPHITSFIPEDGKHVTEIDILQAGTYNLGFIGLSHYEDVKGFLKWWKERLYKYCFSAPEKGLFVDQRWVDLVPGMIEGVFILRDPGYNIAYWNLHERHITHENGRFQVNGGPLYFFHFSGFVFNDLECVSKCQDRFTLKNQPELRPLFERYRDLLVQHDYLKVRDWPYIFGVFDNGVPIHNLLRRLYWGLRERGKEFGNPFETARDNSFFGYLSKTPVPGKPVTNLLHYIYYLRVDLQKTFPDPFEADLEGFIEWAKSSLKKEYGFDDRLLPFRDYKPSAQESTPTGEVNTRYHLILMRLREKFKRFLWNFGTRHERTIKKIPLLNSIAERVYHRLATERFFASSAPDVMEAIRSAGMASELEGKIGVNIAGYIDTESGVGEATRGLIRAIEKVDLPFVLNNIEQDFYRREDRTYTEFRRDNPYPINILHVNADQVPFVARSLGEGYFRDRYNIGCWYWELSRFPEEFHNAFTFFNEIWVASSFCQKSISAASEIPVVKIPPSVNVEVKQLQNRQYFGIPENAVVFLMLFDFLSFMERKNPMAVIEAFKMAFNHKDDAMLIVKSTNAKYNQKMFQKLKESGGEIRIKIIDRYLDKDDIYSLISLSDCYVSLHRSEGFGLPLAEAMFLGKPVIATGYSGNMEFMNEKNSFPVKHSLVELQKDYGPYKKGNIWADPDVEHAAELMRFVVEHPEETAKVADEGREYIRRHFAPESIGKKIRERIEMLYN